MGRGKKPSRKMVRKGAAYDGRGLKAHIKELYESYKALVDEKQFDGAVASISNEVLKQLGCFVEGVGGVGGPTHLMQKTGAMVRSNSATALDRLLRDGYEYLFVSLQKGSLDAVRPLFELALGRINFAFNFALHNKRALAGARVSMFQELAHTCMLALMLFDRLPEPTNKDQRLRSTILTLLDYLFRMHRNDCARGIINADVALLNVMAMKTRVEEAREDGLLLYQANLSLFTELKQMAPFAQFLFQAVRGEPKHLVIGRWVIEVEKGRTYLEERRVYALPAQVTLPDGALALRIGLGSRRREVSIVPGRNPFPVQRDRLLLPAREAGTGLVETGMFGGAAATAAPAPTAAPPEPAAAPAPTKK